MKKQNKWLQILGVLKTQPIVPLSIQREEPFVLLAGTVHVLTSVSLILKKKLNNQLLDGLMSNVIM